MKCLFIADKPADLKPKGDTTLYMVREALRRGWEVYYTTPGRIFWSGTGLFVDADAVASCEKHALPVFDEEVHLSFAQDVDAAFIRKDPPFDADYISMCWLLAAHEDRVRMVNPPGLLVRHHEKMISLDAAARGFLKRDDVIPTFIGADAKRILEYVEGLTCEKIILKPWLGYGGREIRRVERAALLKKPKGFSLGKEMLMVQPYYPEVEKTGDRRGFFFCGKYFGSIVRMPKAGGFVSNLAQGGSAVDGLLSDREHALIRRMEAWLKRTGIVFAGSDFIDGRLSELNITSPTGFASYEELYGADPARALFDAAFPREAAA